MRDYLFRGKRKDNGKWVYGYLVWTDNPIRRAFIIKKLVVDINNCNVTILDSEIYEVIPETVGEYMGLTDKNGKLIFEGDIVAFKRFATDYIGKIVFNSRTYGFEIWRNTTVGAYGEKATHSINLSQHDKIEVIGNIHDNPELLEV